MGSFFIGFAIGAFLGILGLVLFVESPHISAWKYRQVCVEYQIDKPADCAKRRI